MVDLWNYVHIKLGIYSIKDNTFTVMSILLKISISDMVVQLAYHLRARGQHIYAQIKFKAQRTNH